MRPLPRSIRYVLVAAALLTSLYLASQPFLHAARIRPPGTRFWAVPTANYYDANQYLAFTRLVLHGHWLIGDPFTSEPVPPRLVMPHVYFQALLCRALGTDVLTSFQACRVLWGLLLLLAGWWFGTLLIRSWRQRWVFLGLLCFSAGATWVLDRYGIRIKTLDTYQPEAITFFTLGNLPHLSLSAALLISLFCTLLSYERDGERRWLGLTVLFSFLLAWVHPFDFMALGLALGFYGAARWAVEGGFPKASWRHAAALVLGAAPAGAYLLWVMATNPVYRRLASDTLTKPDFTAYAVSFGPFVIPALVLLARRELLRRYLLPICWVAAIFLFLLTPFRMGGKQSRMAAGLHVPLCVLASVGIMWAPRLFRRRPRVAGPGSARWRGWAAAALGAGLVWFGYQGGDWVRREQVQLFSRRLPFTFQPPEVIAAYEELDREAATGDIALPGTFTGGWTPVLSPARSYWGHWHMTLDQDRKMAERDWFFCAPGQEAEKARFLQERGIRWVIYWPWEWSDTSRWPGGPQSPERVPGLRPVYASQEIVIFRNELAPGRS